MRNRLVYELIRATREQAREAHQALAEASPAALERCAEVLKGAAAKLVGCCAEPGDGEPKDDARAEVLRLRADLRVLALLLEHAAGYHTRWRGFAGSAWAGYTGSGAAAGVAHRGRLLTRG